MRSSNYSANDTNQDLMELLEWMDYKYEAYLRQVNLLKHEQMNISYNNKNDIFNVEVEALKTLAFDHKKILESLGGKIHDLNKMIALMEKLQSKDSDQREILEEDYETSQFKIQKLEVNNVLTEIRNA